jgi:predicted NAD-dependent protein-ADP-ribosyltransferase YbiA (DUF1768 family)
MTRDVVLKTLFVVSLTRAGMPLEELIRKAVDPLRAKKMGEDKDIPPRGDWKDKQEEVM